MSLIHIDFTKRIRLDRSPSSYVAPAPDPSDIFAHYDHMIECINNRFGGDFPVYKQKLNRPIFDTYGHGNVHNSIHQKRTKIWNRPMPIPADLRAIDEYFKRNTGKVLVLGDCSDPFMWMDVKYSITKSVLSLANTHKVQLELRTISDLCAHDEYIELIKAGGHSVVMNMGFEEPFLRTDKIERAVSPGAPSLSRRLTAMAKLETMGIEVTVKRQSITALTKQQRLAFEHATGTSVEYWTGETRGAR